jgi:tripartite-type tricarboxylate transporter receptor subunit TctC
MRRLALAAALAASLATPAAAEWPEGPVTLVVPYPRGGPSDRIARIVAPAMARRLGQEIQVENRPGSGGMIAADHVSKSKPDGYTLLVANTGPNAIEPALKARPPYAAGDFTYVAPWGTSPVVMAVSAKSMVGTLDDWLRLAMPGTSFASGGVGTVPHLAGELAARAAGVKATHYPFGGAPAAVAAALDGKVLAVFTGASDVAARGGKSDLIAIAVAGEARSRALPGVPTFRERGVDVVAQSWYGVAAPPGLPPAVAARIEMAAAAAIGDPAVSSELAALGVDPLPPGPFADFARGEAERWKKVVESLGPLD